MLQFKGKIPPDHQEAMELAYEEACNKIRDRFGNSTAFQQTDIQVSYNNRLRTTAGKVGWKPGLQAWRLELNPKYGHEFGFERMVGTFRHELAHVAAWIYYKDHGHTKNFKRLCTLFGGTMNRQFAKREFADAATDQYLRTSPKLKYICPGCGCTINRKRKLSKRTESLGYCKVCRTPVRQFEVKNLL